MEYKQEFKGIYKFNEEVGFIWKAHKEQFKGKYKIIKGYVLKEPIYRDDYIEPFDYDYVDYVLIEDIETKEQYNLRLEYFNRFFVTDKQYCIKAVLPQGVKWKCEKVGNKDVTN